MAPSARVDAGAPLNGPLFIDEGCVVKAGARIGPYSVIGKDCVVDEGAHVEGTICWAGGRIGCEARVKDSLLGQSVHDRRQLATCSRRCSADQTVIADYSRL